MVDPIERGRVRHRAQPALGALQTLLHDVYDVATPHAVQEFLITDAQVAERLQGEGVRASPERLLLHSDGEVLDIALYLEHEVLERFSQGDPVNALAPGQLADFCTVLEGISHFVYVTWNAGFDRPVTLLELEMQAEVDKFVAATLLFRRQGARLPALHRVLFELGGFDAALAPAERRRYETASALAGRYCRRLEGYFLERGDPTPLLRELRRFWRMPQRAKIRHIHALA